MVVKASVREKYIQQLCLETLALLKKGVARAWRNNAGMARVRDKSGTQYVIRLSPKGTPDIIGFLRDGRFLAVEIKREGGRRRPEQIQFLEDLISCGGVALLVESPEEMILGLQHFGVPTDEVQFGPTRPNGPETPPLDSSEKCRKRGSTRNPEKART